jgi:acyl carrier protein
VERLFEHKLGLPVPSPDADLFKSGMMDSLAFVNMLLHLEKEFGLKFSLDDIDVEKFRSVASIADYIGGLISGGAADGQRQRPVSGVEGRHARR